VGIAAPALAASTEWLSISMRSSSLSIRQAGLGTRKLARAIRCNIRLNIVALLTDVASSIACNPPDEKKIVNKWLIGVPKYTVSARLLVRASVPVDVQR